jgi:hypothetical protein
MYYTFLQKKINNKELKNVFIQFGWKPEFVNEHVLENHDPELSYLDVINSYTKDWYKKNRSLKHNLSYLNEKTFKEVFRVLNPLKNTCYTDVQMYEIGIEYILGKYDSIF